MRTDPLHTARFLRRGSAPLRPGRFNRRHHVPRHATRFLRRRAVSRQPARFVRLPADPCTRYPPPGGANPWRTTESSGIRSTIPQRECGAARARRKTSDTDIKNRKSALLREIQETIRSTCPPRGSAKRTKSFRRCDTGRPNPVFSSPPPRSGERHPRRLTKRKTAALACSRSPGSG